MDIIGLAFRLARAVTDIVFRARRLWYQVMLLGYRCPGCGGGLQMVAEGRCRCRSCGQQLDPTVAFQRCPDCGGVPQLRVRRYRCSKCGTDIASRFLFDGLAFDAVYFRTRMAESRQRKKEQRERVRQMLAESRSQALAMPAACDLDDLPGLLEALDSLMTGPESGLVIQPRASFDLRLYQKHIQAHLGDFAIALDAIPALAEDTRRDRIWRFIAVIFMAHFGQVDIWQDGPAIMVMQHEANREGQDILGDTEEADGVQGLVGGAQA